MITHAPWTRAPLDHRLRPPPRSGDPSTFRADRLAVTRLTSPSLQKTLVTELALGSAAHADRAVSSSDETRVTERPDGHGIGPVLGDFRLGELLGKGAMGKVFKGVQVSLDRPVAVKVLSPDLGGQEAFRQRFLLEARMVARIHSPHVVQVYGAGVHDDQYYFAMEFVPGSDLAQRLKGGYRPSPEAALHLMVQAVRGLAAAAAEGIVHRDLKPANLMVTAEGQVKLMDFGLVKDVSHEHGLTMAGTVMGTASYLSPEQARGERCDQRTDIYSLGVVFYELLTGHLPFVGQDATSVIYQHVHAEPRSPREVDPTIPATYQAVVMKCLRKRPEDRYQTALDLLQDLELLVADPETRLLAATRRRQQVLVGGLAAAAIAGFGAAALACLHPRHDAGIAAATMAGVPAQHLEAQPHPPAEAAWRSDAKGTAPANPADPQTLVGLAPAASTTAWRH